MVGAVYDDAVHNPYAPPGTPNAAVFRPARVPETATHRAPPVSVLEGIRAVWDAPRRNENLLLGCLVTLIPVAGPIVMTGWRAEYHQRLLRGHPDPLVKFDFADFGHYLGRGVNPFVANLVVMLPAMLGIYALGVGVGLVATVVGTTLESTGVVHAGQVAGGVLLLLGTVLVSAVANAAQTRAELTEDVGETLNLGAILSYVRSTWTPVLTKMLIFAVVGGLVMVAGVLACFVGVYLAAVLLQLAQVHLRWQIYSRHLAMGGEAIPVRLAAELPSEAVAHSPTLRAP